LPADGDAHLFGDFVLYNRRLIVINARMFNSRNYIRQRSMNVRTRYCTITILIVDVYDRCL